MGRQPEVLWAQRSDKIYLTVSLPDARDVSVESEPQGVFRFSAVGAQDEHFDFTLELYDTILPECNFEGMSVFAPGTMFTLMQKIKRIHLYALFRRLTEVVDKQASKTVIGMRSIICSIKKEKKGWWKRLLKSEEKPAPYIKVDWNKWCDEDEEESEASDSFPSEDENGLDHGVEDESSDDDGLLYLPDLEKARGK